MPDVADENASLEDSRTTMMGPSERSTPESKADRSNIIATRYRERHYKLRTNASMVPIHPLCNLFGSIDIAERLTLRRRVSLLRRIKVQSSRPCSGPKKVVSMRTGGPYGCSPWVVRRG